MPSGFKRLRWHVSDGTPPPDWARALHARAQAELEGTIAKEHTIIGKLVLDSNAQPFANAKARIVVEDVTHAGASAKVEASLELPDIASSMDLAFTLTFKLPDNCKQRRFNVRATIDVDGDGKLGRGDYVSTIAYPVLQNTEGPECLEVLVTRVA